MSAIRDDRHRLPFAARIILGLPLLLVSAALITSGAAQAFCYAPDAPSSFHRPSKPTVPFCVNEWNNTHTCDEWQISSYNNDVQTYNSDVEDYVRRLKRYAEEAVEYARCEINDLD